MRIAATADLHFAPPSHTAVLDQLGKARDEADVLVLAGDLTNYGLPAEMEPLINALVRLRVPTIAVLGNHDYESGRQAELIQMMTTAGIKVLDGSGYERDGVGFAGTKGFIGGFGRGVLTAFGEPAIKELVRLRLMKRSSWSAVCHSCARKNAWSYCIILRSQRRSAEKLRRFIRSWALRVLPK